MDSSVENIVNAKDVRIAINKQDENKTKDFTNDLTKISYLRNAKDIF